MSSPEASLAAAVVQRAVDDALCQNRVLHDGDGSRGDGILFCTSASGEWAHARAIWCDAAGIDPNALRHRIIALRERLKNRSAKWRKKAETKRRENRVGLGYAPGHTLKR